MSGTELLIALAYLIASVLFILGLKRLSSPRTARSGNLLGAVGMLIAIVVTLLDRQIVTVGAIVLGVLIGTLVGVAMARLVKMTAMPQMVGALNGFGGGASLIVASAEYLQTPVDQALRGDTAVTIVLSVLIGGVTLAGSFVAFGKLQELVTGRAVTYPLQKTSNALLFAGLVALGAWIVATPVDPVPLWVFAAASLLLGILVVIPIGGADMPVVISLLNSYSGLAAAATGFVLQNNVLIIAGALVGASGLILTRIMCVAMNRSLVNVLFGAFGAGAGTGAAAGAGPDVGLDGRIVRDTSAEDVAMLMAYSGDVVVVPGYGLAVAQAQHQVREMAALLEARGVRVKYAIHPVAGRMPGHMNVLLAEANVPYEQLFEMEQINPELSRTDVALVIGANDVVNPAAKTTPGSPIYGMPIVNVDEARNVIVLKRSMSPGFAGIDNELFYADNTRMLFGDARASLTSIIAALKQQD
ncbi:MAG: NAD(P)(+) transhydrogenase (Re/Si-specific) subunit beta [Longimicrobiales bacterium]